ncbi:protein-disulfide reductase DsbD family protein [Aestuariispira insulae]|uniref:Suppressor for copper-sensitivity B n=1 Tax=Aestuariispira insulae TaxID=1461337 RepID=A0A3D9HXX9_9PROT|nr:protein-disulfide reductase DsbD domain-containing protein [Aestuariispira insulae]RED54358.1 suppressor for copper-sensitivity B [Aestuariispira insulae]
MIRHPFPTPSLLFGFLALFFAPPHSAQAGSGEWDRNEHAAVRLISAIEGTGERDALPLGLEFQLQPGWKIYWRTPGDAGFPPIPDWSPSANVSNVEMRWPRPDRFEIFDLETLGYKDEVVFPLTVIPETPGAPLQLAAKIPYLACSEVCIPYEANLSLNLPAGADTASPDAHLISRYDGAVPVPADQAGITFPQAGFDIKEDVITLQIQATSRVGFDQPDLIVEGPEGSYFHKPKVQLAAANDQAVFTVQGGGVKEDAMLADAITVTLWDGTRSVEAPVSLSTGLPFIASATNAPADSGLWTILGFALLGGLILNLMPCVLPVLSLKLLSVLSHGGSARRTVRVGFLASAAGILTAFLILGGALALMKQAGIAVGWGIQFQNPLFITVMILVVILFAANLMGLFQLRLPGSLSNYAANAGRGQKGLGGHFITGMFATLLATPCSAPFLGPAVGFALSRDTADILMVFTMLGLGLALPYLMIAALPGLVSFLPRPGNWMNKMKLVLSLALIGTAAWLLTVLDGIAGSELVTIIAAFTALILAVLLVRSKLPAARVARMAPLLVLLLAGSAVTAVTLKAPSPAPIRPASPDNWISFDETAIPALVGQGQVVFVDVTADWCITCLFNKKNVLEAEPVASLLASGNVTLMRADWTRPDPAIADYLNRHGRYGIPFNMIYGPGQPDGIALSEFLISGEVVEALDQAAGAKGLANADSFN